MRSRPAATCISGALASCTLLAGAGAVIMEPRTEASPADPLRSFLSDDGLFCVEGAARAAEGCLGLYKAGVMGALMNMSTTSGLSCKDRGYAATGGHAATGGEQPCYPGTWMFLKNNVEDAPMKLHNALNANMEAFGAAYGLDVFTVERLSSCSCHPDSALMAEANRKGWCKDLDVTGAWVHGDPYKGGDTGMCYEGPFVHATYALAIEKSSAKLLMHRHDRIAATSCRELGFPVIDEPENPYDKCWPTPFSPNSTNPPMKMWFRSDARHERTSEVEDLIYPDFKALVDRGTYDGILYSEAVCQCLPGSFFHLVYGGKDTSGQDACKRTGAHSPIRDWWLPF